MITERDRTRLLALMRDLAYLMHSREHQVWLTLREIYVKREEYKLQHYYQLVTVVDGHPVDPENTGFDAMKGIKRILEEYFTKDPEGKKSKFIIVFSDHVHVRLERRPIWQFAISNLYDPFVTTSNKAKNDLVLILNTFYRSCINSVDLASYVKNEQLSWRLIAKIILGSELILYVLSLLPLSAFSSQYASEFSKYLHIIYDVILSFDGPLFLLIVFTLPITLITYSVALMIGSTTKLGDVLKFQLFYWLSWIIVLKVYLIIAFVTHFYNIETVISSVILAYIAVQYVRGTYILMEFNKIKYGMVLNTSVFIAYVILVLSRITFSLGAMV